MGCKIHAGWVLVWVWGGREGIEVYKVGGGQYVNKMENTCVYEKNEEEEEGKNRG